jgi:hypothetical protein
MAEVFSCDSTFSLADLDQTKIICLALPHRFQTERRYLGTFLKQLFHLHVLRRFDLPKAERERLKLLVLLADEAQHFVTASEDGLSDHSLVDVIRESGAAFIAVTQSTTSLIPPLGAEQSKVLPLNLRNRLIFTAANEDDAKASSPPLSYQWRFNSNVIAGATGPTYTIPNVAAFNAGYYDCVVKNTGGLSNVTAEAKLVVGAANFLSHRYSFTVDGTDSIGGANGTVIGTATISGGQLNLDGASTLQLPANLYTSSSATAHTVEFWATFGPSLGNQWVYIFNNSYNGNQPVGFFGLRFDGSGQPVLQAGRSLQIDETATSANSLAGLTMHVACTWDPPNKTIAIYTNGFLAAINTNAPVSIADVPDTLSFLGAVGNLTSGSGYLYASFDEVRMFNGALSPITIKQSDDQGPNVLLASGPVQFATQPTNTPVPAGQTATFSAVAVGYLPISYQWFKNGAPIPGATNASCSFAVGLADNNASIVCYATNTIGVTTYHTNSATATLSVFLPPTLAWLGTAGGGADNT